jgi:ATP-binding cassette subfamily C protein LapB
VLLISLVANLLTLAVSLFTMFVYNTIIPSGAMLTLMAVTLAAVIAVLGGWGLRMARAQILATMTAWAGAKISNLAYRKALGLPLEVSARVGVDSNLSRLRSIESVRQWFGGGGGAVSADYPFAVIFLLVIALLGWLDCAGASDQPSALLDFCKAYGFVRRKSRQQSQFCIPQVE